MHDRDRPPGALGSLAGGVAHELGEPLAALISNLTYATEELLAAEAAPEQQARILPDLGHALAEALEAAQRLRALAINLRVLSRPESQGRPVADLKVAFGAALHMLHQELHQRATVEVDLQGLHRVAAREAPLGQLFLLLLLHVSRRLPDRGPEKNVVRVTATAEGSEVRLEILDNGDTARSEPTGATPPLDPLLTLAAGVATAAWSACQGLAQQLGGRIEQLPVPLGGNLVRLHLPAAPRQAKAPSNPGLLLTRPLSHLLVIDDEPLIGEAVQRMLAGEVSVSICTDPAEGLRRLLASGGPPPAERFDAVFCDLIMPGLSGFALFRALEQAKPELSTRVGFLTGGVTTDEAQAFRARHTARVLEKPFSRTGLRRLLEALLERRFAHDPAG